MRRFGLDLLRAKTNEKLTEVHAVRRDAFWRAVDALLLGGRLSLTALGRALQSDAAPKHRIKAIDRLLGNLHLAEEGVCFYGALLAVLFRSLGRQPLIVVDWTEHSSTCVLSAGLLHGSRALPIYNEAHPRGLLGNERVHRRFLGVLKQLLPPDAQPIIITDAGFQRPWFDAVAKLGWLFIGRIRNVTMYSYDGRAWSSTKSLYSSATPTPVNLGEVHLRREKPARIRLVLFQKKLKGRVHRNKRGVRSRGTEVRKCARRTQEPWLLAVSPGLQRNARYVVNAYAARFQIEQSFRDTKDTRFGWAAKQSLTRRAARVNVLYLIATYARLACELIGIAAERNNLHKRLQANTTRARRVLSRFTLARLIIDEGIGRLDLRAALTQLLENIHRPRLAIP